jgi:hypothetical protein
MVVMFDNHVRQGIDRDSKIQYLLELLADDLIEASLYANEGPPAGASRPVNANDGVSAPLGWVEIRPAEQTRQRLVAWTRDGVSTEQLTHIETSAYQIATPIHILDPGTPQENLQPWRRPLALTEHRLLWQLGLLQLAP